MENNSPKPNPSEDFQYSPKIFSQEEIDMFIKGDRGDIDRLLLYSMNRIAAVLIPHAEREESFMSLIESTGGMDAVRLRADYVNSLIEKNNKRSAAWEKISQSTTTWALIAFLGFIAVSAWQYVVSLIRKS